MLKEHEIAISMDGKGRATDNAVVERLNGTLRTELVNRHWFQSLEQARVRWSGFRGQLFSVILFL